MYQRDALTLGELEMILLQREPCKAARFLLVEIVERSPRAVYDCFMDALRETGQQDVYMLISCLGMHE